MPARVSKPSQRQRLVDGMIAVAARYGYGQASVARVVRQAGVSRATFYEHFADRDDCFLAAYGQVAGQVTQSLGQGHDRSPRAILGDLLANADREPAAARICLIEGLAAGDAVRRGHEELLTVVERSVDRYLDDPPPGGAPLEVPARALLGGVAGVVAIRVFRGERGRLSDLRDDLVTWAESYAIAGARQRRSTGDWTAMGKDLVRTAGGSPGPGILDRRLPRGRAALPPTLVVGEQRERVLAAMARLAREKGYTATTVADVVTTAGVTREAFYGLFRSKEDAFLATQAFALEESVSLTAGTFFGKDSWPDRVWGGMEAMLGYIAAQRDLVYVDLIESYAAGAGAIRRSFENRMAYTLFLEDGYRQRPEAAGLPRLISEAISGAIQELFRRQVVLGRTERMLELLPQTAYLTLAPFIGPANALELIETKMRTRRRSSRESPGRG